MRRNEFGRKLVAALCVGSWLTPERLRVYPAMFGGSLALAVAALVVTGHGATDRWNRPLGTDFSGVWVAGRTVLAGYPARPYDNALHAAAQVAAFGPSDSFLPWPYPPYFLALAALLATMPYLVALAAYQGATLLLYCGATLRAARGSGLGRRDVLLAALAFPAVAINLLHGHNGFLSAALIAGGALLVPRRPLLAGVLFGLLAYKPQLALAIPVALLAGGHRRAMVSGVLTVLAATVATLAAFGPAPWRAFAGSLAFTRHVVLEMGGLDSYKLQSAFAAVRLLGASVTVAYVAQTAVSGLVLVGLAWLWRRATDHRLKVAGLIVASLLSTPYAMDYDMAMLGPAIAALASFGIERGFAPYGKSLLAIAWVTPLLARVTAMTLALPLGVMVMGALFAAVLLEARRVAGEVASLRGAVSPGTYAPR